MAKIKVVFRFWVPVVLWALIIFLFSNFPTAKASQIFWEDFILKKSAHFVEYAILFILLYRALKNTSDMNALNSAIIALILALLYAFSDEFHQTFIPGREGKVRDVLIDLFGTLAAWFALWKFLPKAPAKLKSWAKNWHLI